MTRFPDRWVLALASVAIVFTVTEFAAAQRGGNRRSGGRGGMVSPVQLASHDAVQNELQLTDEQQQQIREIRDDSRKAMREVFQQEGGNRRAEMQKIAQDTADKLAEVLDDEQEKRLAGILIQVDVVSAMNHPYVAQQLNLTDEQEVKLDEARNANRRAMRDAFSGAGELSREERRTKMAELRATAEKNLTAVLTAEQQATLEELKGEPVEIDMRELRRRGPRGEGRGRRGGDND